VGGHIADREVDVHLAEYGALSAGIQHYVQRIDRIRELYVAGAFGGVAVLLGASPADVQARLEAMRTTAVGLWALLMLPTLNAILLVYVSSYMHYILAAAKYNTYVIGARLQALTDEQVLRFDNWESPAGEKTAWLITRDIAGVLSFALGTLLSIGVLAWCRDAGLFRLGGVAGGLYVLGVATIALSLVVGVTSGRIGARFHDTFGRPFPVQKWYLTTIPVAIALYAVCIVGGRLTMQ
jgi:hypothetical protein